MRQRTNRSKAAAALQELQARSNVVSVRQVGASNLEVRLADETRWWVDQESGEVRVASQVGSLT